MDYKKIGLALIVCLAFASLATATGTIIGSGTLPTTDRTTTIDVSTETTIKADMLDRYGMELENLDASFGELVCDEIGNCSFKVSSSFLNDTLYVSGKKCDDKGVCTNKTETELKTSQEIAFNARLKIIEEASETRATKPVLTATLGEGTITVNTK